MQATPADTPAPPFVLAGGPWLFLDAAGRFPAAGVWRDGRWLGWRRASGTAATEGLFDAVEFALEQAAVPLPGCAGFVFVVGPGSILGIRIAAMALRGWRALPGLAEKPVLGTGSLTLAGHLLLNAAPAARDFALLADSRQGWWNVAVVRDGLVPGGFEEMRGEHLAGLPEPRFRITQRALGKPPVPCMDFPEDLLATTPEVLATPDLLFPVDEPDAANIPGEFVKWEPQRHR